MSWVLENKEWLFSGVGVVLGSWIISFIFRRKNAASSSRKILNQQGVVSSNENVVTNHQVVHVYATDRSVQQMESRDSGLVEPRRIKDATRILFIDDDVKFKVIKILRNAGWKNATLVKDIGSLNDQALAEADIVFVDIQGVGLQCGFKDEGLGLAVAIKERYPNKKLVIYSAEPRGSIFHEALKKADFSLEKNADPYEFERLVERFSGL